MSPAPIAIPPAASGATARQPGPPARTRRWNARRLSSGSAGVRYVTMSQTIVVAAVVTRSRYAKPRGSSAERPNPSCATSEKTSRSEEHTSELQSPCNLVCRLLLEKKKKKRHLARIHEQQSEPT